MKKLCFLIFLCSFQLLQAQNPAGRYGKLKLVGLQLSSECGTPVQLKGISTHGPMWFQGCYNTSSLDAIAYTWNADVFRIAMYLVEANGVNGGAYLSNPTKWKTWIDGMVDEAGKRGIYCLIDWHVLDDGDPMANIDAAKDFWDYMSKKHGGKSHVLYEICNEPNERYKYGANANEKDVNWPRIKQYAETIIPIIRKNDPQTIIIVGTPYWSNRPWRVVGNELTGDNAYNVMYTYHFYAATPQHLKNLDTVKTILNKIPIFSTEWGLSEESGDGNLDLVASQNYEDVLSGNNSTGVKISNCIWSFNDKAESSALLKASSCGSSSWNNRSAAGDKAFYLLNNPKKDSSTCFAQPKIVTQPQGVVVNAGASTTLTVGAVGDKLTYKWQKSTNGTTWTDISGATSSSYVIASMSASYEGYYRVTVTNYLGYVISQKAYVHLYGNGPYTGLPFAIPGKIEAELYDVGGQNKTYYDNSAGNTPGAFRNDDVDIETTTDSLGGYSIGYWETGSVSNDWVEYSVNVLATANYDFYFRTGSALSGKSFKVLLDGTVIIPQVNVPNLGDWSLFQFVTVKGITLSSGSHKLRILGLTDGFNLNYIEVKGPKIDCNGDLNGTAYLDSCGYCVGGNTGLSPKFNKNVCYVVTGLQEEASSEGQLEVFPNPFHDKLILQGMDAVSIELFNLEGQKIFERQMPSDGQLTSLDYLPVGIYQLRVNSGKTVKVMKVVKK